MVKMASKINNFSLKHHLDRKKKGGGGNTHLLLNPFLRLLNVFHSFISEGWLQLHTRQTAVQKKN